MEIKEMFKDDIDRKINGVVQVEQDQKNVIEQEVKEYVVTSELKKHFMKFFEEYSDSIDTPTDNVGVWITGFFGSGKSHFLKMLSYLLENKAIDGKSTVQYFEEKFDDELSFRNVVKCTQIPTETILFNIDVEGSSEKDDTAVLKVFAKVFYDHIGLYGSDLKLAKLEQFIKKQGKWDDFTKAFEEIRGSSWIEDRPSYLFIEDDVIEALLKANVMSEENAKHWFDGTETAEITIGQLVDDIKDYIDSKPNDFRLVFMIDEAGQYIGESKSMLLNLQTIIEKLGSVCRGQAWVIATGQEALDEIAIKLREDEFSRIMARFAIRLSLTSSSVDEVIEKRLLTKKDEAKTTLAQVYQNNESALKNQYAFDTEIKDIKGYQSEDEFINVFPFVPYQFTVMQKVFNEIRKHGHAGKHQSSGERSMLNGFQESAQKIETENELTLVPMSLFYDTLHSFLDTAVRSVIERAERAAENGNGLVKEDVDVLKLLYLIRYIDDVPSNLENITILMADKVNIDKIAYKEKIKDSLDRLQRQNYISSVNGIYSFLTDEEQDIARDIKNTNVDSAQIISKIGETIFDDIYPSKKFKYGNYDFQFDEYIDNVAHGRTQNADMSLKFVSDALSDVNNLKLIQESNNNAVVCKLSSEDKYYETIETALKINKYIRQTNVSQKPDTVQKIIQSKSMEASQLLKDATESIEKAIINGDFYILGNNETITGSSAKATIDSALEILVKQAYEKLDQIEENYNNDADIKNIIIGAKGVGVNEEASKSVYDYLELQKVKTLPTSMNDIQTKFQQIPYGWKEIDIAGVVAKLIYEQKVTIKHNGETIQPTDSNLVDYLRKKTEIGNTRVSIRETIPASKIQAVKGFLRDYFNCTGIPDDEDSLIQFIFGNFQNEKAELLIVKNNYQSKTYPGSQEVDKALDLVNKVNLAHGDNTAFIDKIIELQDDLLDSKDDMENVKNFFESQRTLYDNARDLMKQTETVEKDYLMDNDEVKAAVEDIREIIRPVPNYNYSKIPSLNNDISTINNVRDEIIKEKKDDAKKYIESSIKDVEDRASDNENAKSVVDSAKTLFTRMNDDIDRLTSIPNIVAKRVMASDKKKEFLESIDSIITPVTNSNTSKKIINIKRSVEFECAIIQKPEDADKYTKELCEKLIKFLQENDEVNII